MNFVIAGGTGLVGQKLTEQLLQDGHNIFILTRRNISSTNENLNYIKWFPFNKNDLHKLENTDVFINLAGETINQRWTEKNKQKILSSRLNSTSEIANIISKLTNKPQLLIQASAVGYYGTSKVENFSEYDDPISSDFLATTVLNWENAAKKVKNLGIRTVLCRFGLILDKDKGALPTMALPYRLFGGGKMGSGNQWVSWIHINDVVRAIKFIVKDDNIEGPVNFVAPNPVTNDMFGRAVGKALIRPHWFPVPSFLLKTILGEMSLLVLEGQKVIPKKLLDNGFSFQYNNVEDALRDIFTKTK